MKDVRNPRFLGLISIEWATETEQSYLGRVLKGRLFRGVVLGMIWIRGEFLGYGEWIPTDLGRERRS